MTISARPLSPRVIRTRKSPAWITRERSSRMKRSLTSGPMSGVFLPRRRTFIGPLVKDLFILDDRSRVIQAGDFLVLITRGDKGLAIIVIDPLGDAYPYLRDGRALLTDRQSIFEGQRLAVAFLSGEVSSAYAGSHLKNPDGIRAIVLEICGDVAVEYHQDGRHRDERGNSDDYAQYSQK